MVACRVVVAFTVIAALGWGVSGPVAAQPAGHPIRLGELNS